MDGFCTNPVNITFALDLSLVTTIIKNLNTNFTVNTLQKNQYLRHFILETTVSSILGSVWVYYCSLVSIPSVVCHQLLQKLVLIVLVFLFVQLGQDKGTGKQKKRCNL